MLAILPKTSITKKVSFMGEKLNKDAVYVPEKTRAKDLFPSPFLLPDRKCRNSIKIPATIAEFQAQKSRRCPALLRSTVKAII